MGAAHILSKARNASVTLSKPTPGRIFPELQRSHPAALRGLELRPKVCGGMCRRDLDQIPLQCLFYGGRNCYWGFPAQVSVLNPTISQKGESYEEPLTAVFKRNAFLRPLHWKHLFLFMQFFIYKRISYTFILKRLFQIEKKKNEKPTQTYKNHPNI